ncbi:glycosyltransferase family 4 protein [Micromonospora sp. CPCC 205556]|uniref:glycosyltransferase family 4 protein n=1 Tax=Micromonospora sp. CPCC 205556 TaxID=3122398 RepID=UPI002FF1B315
MPEKRLAFGESTQHRAGVGRGAAGRPFRVLVTCAVFEPGFRGGGPVRSVAHILDGASPEVAPVLVTRDRDLGTRAAYPGLSGRWVDRGASRIFYFRARRPRHWWLLGRELRAVRFDLLYVNSLWALMSIVPILAVRLRMLRVDRVMVAPRGECSAGALSLKTAKKRLFVIGWRRLLRGLDTHFHASTDQEAADIRRVFPWATVVVNANQTPLPPEPLPVPPLSPGPLRLVFVGRIAAMKNLTLVLEALAGVRRPVLLDIYGPLEDAAYWQRCQTLLSRLPPTARATYRGELASTDVRRVIAGYDAAVLPTLGENFGHVIAESLSASCPVVCSDRTPWTAVLRDGGGEVLEDLTPAALTERIERLAALSPRQRHSARVAAGAAYRRWWQRTSRTNVLDQVRLGASGADLTAPATTAAAGHIPL